mmetsp:Transcript_52217/g.124488  ORF Transcript_52217/g.124488 Transcript_52217/m.124488 type:complete len:332 (+) Transcript_52217:148-1143(+)
MGCASSSKSWTFGSKSGAPRQVDTPTSKKDEEERQAKREKSESRIRALSESLDPSAFSRSQKGGRISQSWKGPGGGVRQSQLAFADRDQTIIIFDWDDTLCPTTWLRSVAIFGENGQLKGAVINSEARKQLHQLSEQVVVLLQLAQTLGKVVIVTNARRPWVDTSCHHLLPAVKSHLKEITVEYALEHVAPEEVQKGQQEAQKNSGTGAKNDSIDIMLTETKYRAMKVTVQKFYSRYENQSWKNLISIGDAHFEHHAIRKLGEERPSKESKCRVKTIKLIEGPTLPGLVLQLQIVTASLMNIIKEDDNVHCDMGEDQEDMSKWAEAAKGHS